MRARVRGKANTLKVEMARSGINGTRQLRGLDDQDSRVLSIMSLSAVEGDLTSPEVGVSTQYAAYSAPVSNVLYMFMLLFSY